MSLPFLTAYDPPGTSEGTLDPMGLYQIADQLGTKLVPAVRERMQRVRFLTAMAVGASAAEGLEADPSKPEAAPPLVWEWLVVESIVRAMGDDPQVWGVPGTLVARRAVARYDSLDHRTYLKTPRIFGFHGVYKRLAVHTGIVDVHMGPQSVGEQLVDTWLKDGGGGGGGGGDGRRAWIGKWRQALQRSLAEAPPRTRTGWREDDWRELAEALAPARTGARERRYLKTLLLEETGRPLGALRSIWELQATFADDAYSEEVLHDALERAVPSYAGLIQAIRAYEGFCRGLQDAFDLLLAEAQTADPRGFVVTAIAAAEGFVAALERLDHRYVAAREALSEVDSACGQLFDARFAPFAEPMEAGACALAICAHHEQVQKAKSAEGKRAWFDRLASDRIYVRQRYREPRREARPGRYVHDYRGRPIRNFYMDLR